MSSPVHIASISFPLIAAPSPVCAGHWECARACVRACMQSGAMIRFHERGDGSSNRSQPVVAI